MIVFIVSGIWHGANYTFIIWGLLHGFYSLSGMILKPYRERLVEKMKINPHILNLLNIVLTILLVTFAWIFFRAATLGDAWSLIHNLKSFGEKPFVGDGISNMAHSILAIVLLFIVEYKMEYITDKFNFFSHKLAWVRWSAVFIALFIIMLFGVFSGGQFIYFQF